MRGRWGGFGQVIGRVAVPAFTLGLLIVMSCAPPVLGLTNTSAILDVGAGENVTLDGVRPYTTSINVHDGGYVYVGGSGWLTLKSPSITVQSGGAVYGSERGPDGTGASIALECTLLNVASGYIMSDGRAGLDWPWDGRAGGSVAVTATREVQVTGAGIYARGGNGYSLAGGGGNGGSTRIVSPRIRIVSTGTISTNGGSAAHLTGYDGGDAGDITLITGRYEQPSAISAHGGDASSQDTPFGVGGDGGDGGDVVVTADCEIAPAGAIDIGGGLPGTGEEHDGTPGATGTITRTVATNAPYDVAPTIDGYIPPMATTEYYLSWYWTTILNDSTEVFVHENGVNLYVGARRIGTASGFIWLTFDTNNNGGTAPQTDDRAFLVGTGTYNRGQIDEYVGNGTAWTHVGASGWWGWSWLQAGPSDHCEWQIPLTKLGISPGSAKTLGMAMTFIAFSDGVQYPWPSGTSYTSPDTWPDLSSFDNWTLPGNTIPAGWSGFTPTATNTATPNCSVQVSDGTLGLDVSTAQYRYSTNSGVTWSSWAAAACTGSDGTTAPQTLTASSVPLSVSTSTNRVQFRISDTGGALGESQSYAVAVDTVAPTPWAGFFPVSTITNTLAPNCGITIRDAGIGLTVTSAQYRYSTNGGSSWSGWGSAACTGANGTTVVQTITAYAVPFLQNSLTANQIQFRISDVAGTTATSGSYTVPIAASTFGLPLNGDFEFGADGAVPLSWATSSYVNQPVGDYAQFSGSQIVTYSYYHLLQCTYGEMQIALYRSGRAYVAEHELRTSTPCNLSGTTRIDLAMSGINTAFTGTTPSVWDIGIALRFTDGSTTQTVYLYRYTNTGTVDARTGSATGTDGSSWGLYEVTVPGGLDLSHTTVSVVWRATATTAGTDSTLRCWSRVDWIRAWDAVPPASSASVSDSAWSSGLTRSISFLATDYVGLASVQLWKRSDTGSGFGPWLQDQSASTLGTSTTGTFNTATPTEGRYEFYTRAIDASGNVEAAPASADAWCAVDRSAPTFGDLAPSGWVSDLTPQLTINVRDVASGLGLAPAVVGSLPELYKASDCVEYGTTVYSNQFNWLSVADVSIPAVPVDSGGVDMPADITDLEIETGRPWLYAALGNAGVAAINISAPLTPEPVVTLDGLGDIRYLATGISRRDELPLLFASDGRFVHIISASNPAELKKITALDVGGVTDIAFADGLLYVAQRDGILWVFDVSNPEDPAPFDNGPGLRGEFTLLAIRAGRLYVADSDGRLSIWDTAGIPETWVALTVDPAIGLFPGIPYALRVAGDRLFVATDSSDVEVIDVSNPAAPSPARTLAHDGGKTLTVAPLGRYAVTFNENAGMSVWGFHEPAYRFSSDAGGTWSDWFAAGRTYTSGTTTTQTLTATRAEFTGDSATANVVEFAAGDVLTHLGTSGVLPIRVDTTLPRVMGPMSTTHSNPASWYPATTMAATWGDYSDLSGSVGYAVGWDDTSATVLPPAVTTTVGSATRTSAPEGVHYLHVRPVDAAGNWGDTSHLAYRIDFTAPTAPTGTTASPTASTTDSFTVSWTSPAQTYAPLDAAYYKLDAAPVSPTDGTLVPGATSSMSGIRGLTEGTHTVYVWLRDAAGNVNHANRSSATFVYDASAPAAPTVTSSTHSVEGTWYVTSPVQLSWLATDSGSLIDGYSWGHDTSATAEPDYVSDGTTTTANYALSDGVSYFHVRARNAAGLWSAVRTFVIRRDSTAPAGSVTVNAGSTATSSTAATVGCSMTDISPMTMRYSLDGGATWSGSVSYAATQAVTLPGTDGTKSVTMRFTDAAGNVTDRSDAIVLDTTQPTGTISANSGATYTNVLAVTLTNAVTDATPLEMRFSGNSGSTWSTWEAYVVTKSGIAIPAGDGAKTVLGEFRDAAGNVRQLSDTIVVDQTGPAMGAITSESHAAEASWYADQNPLLAWSATDAVSGVSGYTWTLDANATTAAPMNGESYTTSTSYSSLTDGVWYFHARARDGAGNWGVTAHRTVRVDTTAPSGTLSLDAGAAVTEDVVVSADSSVSDISPMQMRFSVNGGSAWTSWETYAAHLAITIPSVEGTATVLAEYRDAAGNVRALSDTIVADLTTEMDRVAGDDRYETAAMVSALNFVAGTCDYVVVATGAKFPDALGAAGLAGSYECPLLLTDPGVLPPAIRSEIVRTGATNCFIIGSASAVSDAVKNAIDAIPGMNAPVRLAGTNRYETAARVAQQIATHEGVAFGKRAFVARGDNFADALAASPLAYSTASPVLLVQTTALPDATRSAFVSLGITDAVIAGSDKAVSASVKSAIDAIPGVSTPVRVAGADRYATAAAVATYGVDQGWATWGFVGVATGQNFPDALGGGAACGSHRGVLLLTSTTALSPACRSAITAHTSDIGTVQVFGGTSALSASAYAQILNLVQ